MLGQMGVRGARSEELPTSIPELPVERELKLEDSPTAASASQLSRAAGTRQSHTVRQIHNWHGNPKAQKVEVKYQEPNV